MKSTTASLLDSALIAAEVKCTLLRLLLETQHEDVRIQSITDRIARLQRQIDRGHALIAAIKEPRSGRWTSRVATTQCPC